MVRPREFDEASVIDGAMLAFWRLGYAGCTVRDLVDATGVQRQSLYNIYGDKEGLFVAALARYREHVDASLAPLQSPDAGISALRRYVEEFLATLRKREVHACLLVKTAFGPESNDPQIRRAVEAGGRAVRAAFAEVVRGAIARGELPATVEPKTHAALVFTLLHGLAALARTGGAPQVETLLSHPLFHGGPA
jgi:TetR/AcrR family transcriptional repressor of nem operon